MVMALINHKYIPYYCFLFVSLFMLGFYSHAQNPARDSTGKGTSKIVVITKIGKQQLIKKDTSNLTVMVGNVGLQQGSTKLYCDSLVQNEKTNIIEAFGHVHINDEDSFHTYSEYLQYNTKERKAFLIGNVKLVDRNNATLTTKQLNYDLNTKIGVYSSMGRIVNKSTVLTSVEGTYYAQTHDAQFKKDVILTDPEYSIKTDTLLYNTETQLATFTVPTEITTGKRKIITTDGYYNKLTKKSYFGKRSTIVDSTSTLIADEMAYDDSTKFGEARGNVVSKDTAQGTVLICNNFKFNRSNDSYLATINPVMIVKQDNDSLFIAADTLYSARLSDRINATDSGKVTAVPSFTGQASHTDSSGIKKDTATPQAPEYKYLKGAHSKDSVAVKAPRYVMKNGQVVKEGGAEPAEKPKAAVTTNTKQKGNPKNGASLTPLLGLDSTQTKAKKDTTILTKAHPPERKKTKEEQENDKKNHYVEAYYHVRIYSDSMQAVGDSLFYSFKDSTFRLFKDPIVWSQDNQLVGDTIYMNTENKKPKHIYVFENSFAISKAEGNSAKNIFYNQLKGRTIEGWFTKGNIDSIHAKGSPAESVYYMVGDDKKYTGVNKITSSVIDMYYLDKKPNKVAARNDVKGTVYPMRQANHEDLKLRGFKWYENRRPKSKYELLGLKPAQ